MAKPKKGCLGCSLPVAIGLAVVLLAVVLISLLAGPLGQSVAPNLHLPSWLSVHRPEIKLPSDVVFNILGFSVTNTIIATWITMLFLVVFALIVSRRMKIIPGRLQAFVEWVLGWLYDLCTGVTGEERGRKFFPLVATIFLFVICNAWLALIPGYGSIEYDTHKTGEGYSSAPTVVLANGEGSGATAIAIIVDGSVTGISILTPGEGYTSAPEVEISGGGGTGAEASAELDDGRVTSIEIKSEKELIRAANTDVNMPLAIALITFFTVWVTGFAKFGIKYLEQFINFKQFFHGFGLLFKGKVGAGAMDIVAGIITALAGFLELLGQFIRIVSLTFRLFGNMTAGEILLLMMMFLVPMLVPTIFYGLELLVGFIQALIFSGLTLIYLTLATTPHSGEEHH